MKELILMRHAKSDWDNPSLSDFQRTLNKRGQKAAPFMGQFLAEKQIVPDMVLASTAVRAAETVNFVCAAMRFSGTIEWDDKLYLASESQIMNRIKKVPNHISRLLIVGHNPGIENLIELLSKTLVYSEMPTAGVAYFKIDCDSWNDLTGKCADLQWIKRPKELMK